jgi:hypothetical protein
LFKSAPQHTNFSKTIFVQDILLCCRAKNTIKVYTECASESGDFAKLFFLVRQYWAGCRYRHFAVNFQAILLQWSHGLEHNVLLLWGFFGSLGMPE